MKKRLLILSILMLLVFTMSITCYAISLNCFYSDQSIIAKNPGKAIFFTLIDGFTSTNAQTYKEHAKTQWTGAGISTTYATSRANSTIDWYAGTVTSLKNINADVENYWALTENVIYTSKGTTTYGGTTISVNELNFVRVFTPTHALTSADTYKNMFTHELGHSLGWIGHSSSYTDLMYRTYSDTQIALTTRDKNHLKQMY